ncbi:hypothetical protein D3C75_753210 [compost metagenome]
MSDHIGLDNAFQLVPLISVAAAVVFFYGKRHYHKDVARLEGDARLVTAGPQGSEVRA